MKKIIVIKFKALSLIALIGWASGVIAFILTCIMVTQAVITYTHEGWVNIPDTVSLKLLWQIIVDALTVFTGTLCYVYFNDQKVAAQKRMLLN